MANEIIKGQDLMVFKGGSSLAYATSCSLTLGTSMTSISSKDHGKWDAEKPTKFNWSMSSDNLYTEEDFHTLFTAWKSGTPVTLVWDIAASDVPAPNTDGLVVPSGGWKAKGSGKGLTGQAYISNISVNAPDGDNATYSVDFSGIGELNTYTE